MPLVELVPAPWTDPAIVPWLRGAMERLGQVPIVVNREIDGFVTALRNGTEVPIPGREGLAALAISLAAIESAKTGRVVKPVRV